MATASAFAKGGKPSSSRFASTSNTKIDLQQRCRVVGFCAISASPRNICDSCNP